MRLIDADEFKEYIKNSFEAMQHLFKTDEYRERISKITTGFLQYIDEQPTVDAVEVVRCRDCKYRADVDEPNICGVCKLMSNRYCDGEDCCSYGERKEGEK